MTNYKTTNKTPQNQQPKLLGLVNNYSKAIRYMVNMQKSMLSYTPEMEQFELGLKTQCHFY